MSQTSTALPVREDIQSEYKWHVEDIYATEEQWQTDLAKVKNDLPAIGAYKDTLSQSVDKLAACLRLRDEINILAGKLFAYARLHRDENTANAKYQALVGKTEGMLAEASAATSFIEPEILAMPDQILAAYRSEQPLADYSFYFDNLISRIG